MRGIQRGRARTKWRWESRNREAANRNAKARKFYNRKTMRPCVPLLLVSQRRNLNGSDGETCILFIGSLLAETKAQMVARARR